MVANALGFRTVIVIPSTQAQEKKDALRLLGAELVEVPAVPYANPNNYVKVSGRLAERLARTEPNGAIWANQFDNVANRQAHVETTGPEIWEQTGGEVDGFICAVGTGGTLAGVAEALQARASQASPSASPIRIGAALFSYYTTGELKSEGTSITEGIGQGRITANLEGRDGRPRLPDPRRGGGAGRASICSSTRACASAAPPASMSPARSGSRASSAPARPSSPSSATTARATSPSSTIPSFLRSKGLPVPAVARPQGPRAGRFRRGAACLSGKASPNLVELSRTFLLVARGWRPVSRFSCQRG